MKNGMVQYPDGSKRWYKQGKLHREDGPAIEYDNASKAWFLNGKRHREDGPAIEYDNGNKEWYLHGELVYDSLDVNNIDKFDLPTAMKKSIIKHKLG